jgi:hypothetical protein
VYRLKALTFSQRYTQHFRVGFIADLVTSPSITNLGKMRSADAGAQASSAARQGSTQQGERVTKRIPGDSIAERAGGNACAPSREVALEIERVTKDFSAVLIFLFSPRLQPGAESGGQGNQPFSRFTFAYEFQSGETVENG